MNKCLLLSSLTLALLMACDSGSSAPVGGSGGSTGTGGMGGTGGTPRTCETDIDIGEVQPFGTTTPPRSEGITFDADGNLFVSAIDSMANDQLLSVTTEGTSTSVAEAESILGLASHANGIIAAAIDTGELLLIDPSTGESEPIATGLGAPNFVVTTPWDTILVSDDSIGEDSIDEVTWEGGVSNWVSGVPTPNGMVFSLDGRTLYVASTFQEPGLWRVPVSAEGVAGTPEKWVTFPNATTPDGVAIDSEGNVYVALNVAGQIARVDPEGNATIIAENVNTVASLAFGQGDLDPCSIYATSLFSEQLWRVGIGVAGTE
ncbi:MAG TPA: SMP-30/gluconolactonase/LRE family protein [Polyangiales bacterium]|nr:SMP-30/gluconolactonase/LRE family protein [Polyangiales bacterium]